MSSRTAKFVSALFATLLAGASFVTTSHGAPAEADKCLSGPKGTPPAGGHWYYRVDRVTKRACWYVGDAKVKLSRAAPATSPPAADAASPPTSAGAGTPSSIANARAELPLPPSRVGPEASVFTAPRPLATVAGAIRPETDPRAGAGDTGTRGSIASRWPDLAGVVSTQASPGASPGNSAAPPPASSTAGPPAPRVAPPAAGAALPLAAADALSAGKPAGSVQMLLIAIVGALALAGLLASAILRFGSARHRTKRTGQRVNWDSVRSDRPSLSDEARARTADDQEERIAQLLGRPPRTAT
ncbi:MAG: hypothetical protein V4517_01405 [Pseudomonadota bacterium]